MQVWFCEINVVDSLFAEGGKYVGLTSLDLICDTEDSFNEWIKGVSIDYSS